MCGINGLVSLGAALPPDADARVASMNAAIAHRGPDGEGRWADETVALGHRRLAILDLSDAGHQPMHSSDGDLVLVFNGEIYNYLELAQQLAARGRVMRSRCDTEVILHAYAEWGDDCVRHFNGMWAFALWDRRCRRLFASRDRLGVKPFVYAQAGGVLHFSSEPAGLRAALPLCDANLGRLYEYLAYGYRRSDGESFFAGVNELLPGHNLVVEDGRLRLQRYWQLPERDGAGPPQARAVDELRHLVADAVRLRLRSDVRVALLQSGGLDSSIIATQVDAYCARQNSEGMVAFTAVHPGHHYDESAAVRALLARTRHIALVEIEAPATGLSPQLPAYVAAMQEPQASPTSFTHWHLMQRIREQGIKVVINGQGADEAFAGYDVYNRGYRLLDLLLSAPSRALPEARAIVARTGGGWAPTLAQLAKAALGRRAASAWRGWLSEGGLRVLRPALRQAHGGRVPEVGMTWAAGNLDRHLRSQLLHFGFGQILSYEDFSSMSQGIEIRSPFVDYRLMEFAARLPDDLKYCDGISKWLLRQAFRRELPKGIVDAHRKIGFAQPFEQWARRPGFRALVDGIVASEAFRASRLWNPAALARQLLDPESAARGFPVWRFVVAYLWLQAHGIRNA